MKTFYIGEAAKMIGISSITLKRWLLAGKVTEVQKDGKGWRVFTQQDVDRIKHYHDVKQKEAKQKSGSLTHQSLEEKIRPYLDTQAFTLSDDLLKLS